MSLRRFRVHLKSAAGDQYVTLLARNQEEAEIIAMAHQNQRASRFGLTYARLDSQLERQEITKEQHAAETARREHDQSRYDRVEQVEIAKDENGEPILADNVIKAEAPMKVSKVEERKD